MSNAYYLFGLANLTEEERRCFPVGGYIETEECVEIVQHLDVVRLGWQSTCRIKEWPVDGYIPAPILAVLQLLQCGDRPVMVTDALIERILSRLALPAPPGFVDHPKLIEAFLKRHRGEEISYFSI